MKNLRISVARLALIMNFITEAKNTKQIIAFLKEQNFQTSDYIQSRYRDVLTFFYDDETKEYQFNKNAYAALKKEFDMK